MACILKCANSISGKTRILYRCNLSYQQLNLYLEYLAENDFLHVRKQKGKRFFETTERGKEFLRDYLKIKEILGRVHV